MSTPESHPALHPNPGYHLLASDEAGTDGTGRHFVPSGWEDADRGVCPCGELVAWDGPSLSWIPDRSLRLLVLTTEEAKVVSEDGMTSQSRDRALQEVIEHQLSLNEEVD